MQGIKIVNLFYARHYLKILSEYIIVGGGSAISIKRAGEIVFQGVCMQLKMHNS